MEVITTIFWKCFFSNSANIFLLSDDMLIKVMGTILIVS